MDDQNEFELQYIIMKVGPVRPSKIGTTDCRLIVFKQLKNQKEYRLWAFANEPRWWDIANSGPGTIVTNLKQASDEIIDGYSNPLIERRIR